MSYKIICTHGHYEAFDNKGNFLCSGDSYVEVAREVEKMIGG